MRMLTLNAVRSGMTRLRDKGGASPDTLFELTNGYISASRAPTQRPGTRHILTFPAGTVGLFIFKDKFHVCAATPIASTDARVVIDVLRHPDAGFTGALKKIWYAQPMLGYPYIVAEFDNGDVFHYWLRAPAAWLPNHAYNVGDLVQPTSPNGYYYQATAQTAPPAWAPSVARALDDIVQPTTATGWKYTVTAVSGDNPASGKTEPVWPQIDGATITEFREAGPPPAPPAAPGAPVDDPGGDRYNNPGGTAAGGQRDAPRTQGVKVN